MIAAGAPGTAALLVELGGILVALAVLGRLAARWGIPSIPLYLIAGLAVGEGGFVELLTARDFIESGAQIGVILLLLLLGLEYTGDELTSALREQAPAGAVDLALNASPGVILGLTLGWDYRAALLLGGITYISSSGIIAKVLADLGRTGNRETPVVLAILVTEDLVMALYLPLMAGLLIGGNALAITLEVGLAVTAVVVTLVIAVKHGSKLSALLFNRSDENLLLSLLGLALLVAGLAEQVQASAAVGAFLVGIAISGPAERAARTILAPLRDLFAALFFAFFGLQIDPSQLPAALPLAIGLAVVTSLTKLATGWWGAKRAGIDLPGRLRAGTTLIARGEFSIVIAGIAVAEGIEDDLGPLAAAYVLLLAVLGPLLARVSDQAARRIALSRRSRRASETDTG
ncbi:MAG: cation:proton antiporter [Acidimicrobiales bacterium]|nr:cation:proton antiporter [Acidimicrobiales bacterium]